MLAQTLQVFIVPNKTTISLAVITEFRSPQVIGTSGFKIGSSHKSLKFDPKNSGKYYADKDTFTLKDLEESGQV